MAAAPTAVLSSLALKGVLEIAAHIRAGGSARSSCGSMRRKRSSNAWRKARAQIF